MTTRNHIRIAACSEHLPHARLLLASSLDIQDTSIADAILPDQDEWSRMSYYQRVEKISEWMRAECFACVEDKEEAA